MSELTAAAQSIVVGHLRRIRRRAAVVVLLLIDPRPLVGGARVGDLGAAGVDGGAGRRGITEPGYADAFSNDRDDEHFAMLDELYGDHDGSSHDRS